MISPRKACAVVIAAVSPTLLASCTGNTQSQPLEQATSTTQLDSNTPSVPDDPSTLTGKTQSPSDLSEAKATIVCGEGYGSVITEKPFFVISQGVGGLTELHLLSKPIGLKNAPQQISVANPKLDEVVVLDPNTDGFSATFEQTDGQKSIFDFEIKDGLRVSKLDNNSGETQTSLDAYVKEGGFAGVAYEAQENSEVVDLTVQLPNGEWQNVQDDMPFMGNVPGHVGSKGYLKSNPGAKYGGIMFSNAESNFNCAATAGIGRDQKFIMPAYGPSDRFGSEPTKGNSRFGVEIEYR